jgi:hypothetical protein
MFIGRQDAIITARRALPLPHAQFVTGAGVRDEVLPTLNARKRAVLAAAVTRFASDA